MTGRLEDMELFARIVERGSLSAAARDLGLSKSLVSRRLGQLEDRLGARLVNRTTRRLALTDMANSSPPSAASSPRSRLASSRPS